MASPSPEDAGRGPNPAWPAIGSALILWTTFPPADWGWLAWFALVPLFLLVSSPRPRLGLYLSVWLGGMTFWTLAIQWVRLTDPSAWLGWLVMAFALSLFWPAFFFLARLAVLRLKLPRMIALPIVWVALEYARAYVATGFPWYYLAHSQHLTLPVIQVADFSGSLGISFLIAVVNAWIVDLLTLPLLHPSPRGPRITPRQAIRLGAVVILLGFTLGYGAFRLGTARFRPGPRIALLQSNLTQELKDPEHSKEARTPTQIVAIYQNLLVKASQAKDRPELIVWPETAYPYGFVSIDPQLAVEALDRQVKEILDEFTVQKRLLQRDSISTQLHGWANELGIPMLVGSVSSVHRAGGMSKYNSAILFEPGVVTEQVFHKMHLVPFGEYVPLIEALPWLTRLTPYHGSRTPSLKHGPAPNWLRSGRYVLAPAICFEDTVPQVVRQFFGYREKAKVPDVVVNMSNDGWFHGSSEHDMHLAVSVFRCVENRVPLVRAANTGVSAIVDGNGRVLESLPKLTEGVLAGVIPLDDRTGLYSLWGDWVGQGCLAVTIGLVPLAILRNLRERPSRVVLAEAVEPLA